MQIPLPERDHKVARDIPPPDAAVPWQMVLYALRGNASMLIDILTAKWLAASSSTHPYANTDAVGPSSLSQIYSLLFNRCRLAASTRGSGHSPSTRAILF